MLDIPYRILIAFNPDGSARGAQVQRLRVRAGEPDVELPPEPLAAVLSDPSLSGFASAFAASIVAQRDDALAQRDAARRERDTATASLASVTDERDTARADRDRLAADLEELRRPTAVIDVAAKIAGLDDATSAAIRRLENESIPFWRLFRQLIARGEIPLADTARVAQLRAGLTQVRALGLDLFPHFPELR